MLSALDRGLQFGDGLFETLAVADGRPRLWDAHLARLKRGCERLAIPMPEAAVLRREAEHLIGQVGHGVLKIIVTRGCGGRGYRPPQDAQPNRIMMLTDWPEYPNVWQQEGVKVRICQTRLGTNPSLAGIKHLNRLEQVLARAEWNDPAIAEGLLLDCDDRVIEGTACNLFLQRDGRLSTPRLDRCGVAGVIRSHVLQHALAVGQAVEEADIRQQDLENAEALYLTNSLIGVWRVRELSGLTYNTSELHPVMRAALEDAYRP